MQGSGRMIDKGQDYKLNVMQEQESKTKWHFWTSMIKSFLRIIAGAGLVFQDFHTAGLLLMLAEVLGIIEEL